MMSIDDLTILKSEPVREAVRNNRERNPLDIALDRRVPHAQLVATQVKYLQRARRKLPRLYDACCIIPPRAFEQSSSEDTARCKGLSGSRVLDLTCGLGIDTLALAERFDHVVSLERDEVLAEVVRYNMQLLGVDNVEVVTTSAEEYVAECRGHFDWVYADPDRRSEDARKMVCLEDCSPNMLELMPRLESIAERVAIKLSPMFDCEEAFRLFPHSVVEVVSMGGECKELNIYTRASHPELRVQVVGQGEWSYSPEAIGCSCEHVSFESVAWRYLLVPDVAVQKARVAPEALRGYGTMWSNNGFAFAERIPEVSLPCRVYEIESVERYRPKELKRKYRGCGVEILKRDTRLAVEEVRRAMGARAGCEHLLAVTTIEDDNWIMELINK